MQQLSDGNATSLQLGLGTPTVLLLVAATIKDEDSARGERITDLMNRAGWTDITLAARIGCDRGTPWRWRQGGPIAGRHIGPLVEALETTRRWIVSVEGPASSDEPSIEEAEAASRGEALPGETRAQPEPGAGTETGS
jgi:transcriptional regulator with XRE-family HTH domain